jgi:hypothetical protein
MVVGCDPRFGLMEAHALLLQVVSDLVHVSSNDIMAYCNARATAKRLKMFWCGDRSRRIQSRNHEARERGRDRQRNVGFVGDVKEMCRLVIG